MAGEWLKFEKATLDKPEVLAVAAAMQCDPDLVVGKLIRMWSWFDTHTENGNARGVTCALLDSILRVTGFAENVAKVGWLKVSEDGISLPNFDRHCGETAKTRAMTAKRVAAFKKTNGKGNDKTVTSSLPREEKRREEKEKTAPKGDLLADIPKQIADDFRSLRSRLRAPITQTAMDGIRREAAKANLPVADALAMCCERGWRGFNAAWVNGNAAVNGHVAPQTGTPRQRRELGT